MQDRIELRGLRVVANHGVHDIEKVFGQTFEVDVDVETDIAIAGVSDDLADTVSYVDVTQCLVDVIRDDSVDLVEHLVTRAADAVLDLPGVDAVEITMRKLRPLVGADLCSAAVHIRRP